VPKDTEEFTADESRRRFETALREAPDTSAACRTRLQWQWLHVPHPLRRERCGCCNESRFREIAMQVLFLAVLVHAAHPALEDREVAFG